MAGHRVTWLLPRVTVTGVTVMSPIAGFPVRQWALVPTDRSFLHERLAERFAAMMKAGFLEEVRGLHARGDLTARHPSMRAVGYRQLWAHLDGT